MTHHIYVMNLLSWQARVSAMPVGATGLRGNWMQIKLTPDAIEHIQSKGGQAAIDLVNFTS